MHNMLTQMKLYTLTDRNPPTFELENYTFVSATGETGDKVSKSVVDYIVAPETMYMAGAQGGVQSGLWDIAGSSHRVTWARLPFAKEVMPPKPRPKPPEMACGTLH
jgi:hypothetical protein